MLYFLLDIVFVLCAVGSSAVFVLLSIGFGRARARTRSHTGVGQPDVTVIVAAHNEERNIPVLMAALGAQSYPPEKLRVIVAADRCTDGSIAAVEKHRTKGVSCTILRIDSVEPGVSPKKQALHLAVLAAETEVLLFTDADCRPAPRWVEAMAARFAYGADVVIGLSPSQEAQGGITATFAAYDAARTAFLSIAAAGWDRPYMAVGRNWGYRKSLYLRSGGLTPLYRQLGGDDDLLLQRFLAERPAVATSLDANAACPTSSPATFRALLRRKLRHYRTGAQYRVPGPNGRSSGGGRLLLAGLVAFGAMELVSLVVAPVVLIAWQGVSPLYVLPALAAKLLYDTSFLAPVLPLMTSWKPGPATRVKLAFLELFHVLFSSITSVASLLRPPAW
ncbi:MAG: glycosyltransferase [Ignavibacteria bacterium]|nr:glycosyltransferase [Ignavibacteria bacterium]